MIKSSEENKFELVLFVVTTGEPHTQEEKLPVIM